MLSCTHKDIKNMTTIELLQAVSAKAKEVKTNLTKSVMIGDRSYFNEMLLKFPKAQVNNDIYETINNLSSMYARSLEY